MNFQMRVRTGKGYSNRTPCRPRVLVLIYNHAVMACLVISHWQGHICLNGGSQGEGTFESV
jgi:hypothetical protein